MTRMFAPIVTERLEIVLPTLSDAPRRLQYYVDNRDYFAPWDPERDETFYTIERMERWICDDRDALTRDAAYSLFLLRRDDPSGHIVERLVSRISCAGSFARVISGIRSIATQPERDTCTKR